MDKKNLIYLGVGVLLVFVIYNSTKKMELKEVTETQPDNKNFDNSLLPANIQPPLRIDDGAPIPTPVKKNFTLNLIGVYPRFDTA
jgi:hypothetical protein